MLLAVALLLCGCSDRYGAAADNAALAQAQMEAGNLVEARESIQRAIIARDDVAEYFIMLAQIEAAMGQSAGAFNAYSRALDLQADNVDVLQNIAELGLQTERIEEADDAADRILLLFPGSLRAMLVKGFVAIERGRFDEAREYASEILKLNPDDEGGIILSARLSAIDGKFDEAISIIERARTPARANSDALNATLLEIYRAQSNPEGMRTVFPQVVAASGKVADYQLDYVNFLYKTGNTAAARLQAIKSIEQRPNDTAVLATLNRLFLEYDPRPLSSAQLAAVAQTGTRATQMSLARLYLDTAQLDDALQIIGRPLTENVPEALGLASRIRLAAGDSSEAGRLAALVLQTDPRSPDALLTRSAQRLAAGNADAAIEDANIVVSDAPQEYAGHIALAKAMMAKRSAIRARQVFERGMSNLPQSALLAAAYEGFLRDQNDKARILSLYADLVAASPSSVRTAKALLNRCQEFRDRACLEKSERALAIASRSYVIDPVPGAPRASGLFSRITPEQICRSTGGVCTAS